MIRTRTWVILLSVLALLLAAAAWRSLSAKQSGSVLFLDLAQQQGKAISVESGDESGIAAVSADGQYIVTCVGGDSPSGTLRAYQVSDGTKVADETYTMDTNCKPYEIWVIGHSAYAALGTDDGYALSQAVDLP